MPEAQGHNRVILTGIRWLTIAVLIVEINGTWIDVLRAVADSYRFKNQSEVAFSAFARGMWYVLNAVFLWILLSIAEVYLKRPEARRVHQSLELPTPALLSLSWISRLALATVPVFLIGACFSTWCRREARGWTPHRDALVEYADETLSAGQPCRQAMLYCCFVWISATVAKKYLVNNSHDPSTTPEADYQDLPVPPN